MKEKANRARVQLYQNNTIRKILAGLHSGEEQCARMLCPQCSKRKSFAILNTKNMNKTEYPTTTLTSIDQNRNLSHVIIRKGTITVSVYSDKE